MSGEKRCEQCLQHELIYSDNKCCAEVGSVQVFHYYCASISKTNFVRLPENRPFLCSRCTRSESLLETPTESNESEPEDVFDYSVTLQEEGEWGCLRKLFMREELSDCRITVKENDTHVATFPCHKLIFFSASDAVSEKMQLRRVEEEEIVIENSSPRVVATVLEFIYFGCIALEDWSFTCGVLKLSSELQISKLVSICERFLEKETNPNNVCKILEVAIQTGSEMLKNTCTALCRDTGFVVLNTKAFRECNSRTLDTILNIRGLQVESKMLFKAVWHWCVLRICEEKGSITEDLVEDKMKPWFRLIDFEFLSREELKCVPTSVRHRLFEVGPEITLCYEMQPVGHGLSGIKHRDPTNWRKILFLNDKLSDCSIYVTKKSVCRYPCHKLTISAASPVFKRLLSNIPVGEQQSIELVDLTPGTMYAFLKYMFLDEIDLDNLKFACEVYVSACKYELSGLIPHCEKYIEHAMTPLNVSYALGYAIENNSEVLKGMCVKFIWWNNHFQIVNSREFQELGRETLQIVLALPCFKPSTKYLDFHVLWKMATFWCCKNRVPVTRQDIYDEISPFLKHTDLKNPTEDEEKILPENALVKAEFNCLQPKDDGPTERKSNDPPFRGRKIVFPLTVPTYAKTFSTNAIRNPTVCLKDNFVLFEFSISLRSYLPEFSISHVGPPKLTYLRSLRIYSNGETLAKFHYQKDDDLQMTVTECQEEREITFKALKLLLVEPNVRYMIEVNYDEEGSNLIWANVFLKTKKIGDLEISVVKENLYGLNYITFIPAS